MPPARMAALPESDLRLPAPVMWLIVIWASPEALVVAQVSVTWRVVVLSGHWITVAGLLA